MTVYFSLREIVPLARSESREQANCHRKPSARHKIPPDGVAPVGVMTEGEMTGIMSRLGCGTGMLAVTLLAAGDGGA